MPKLSRRKLASYASTRLLRGDATTAVMNELAAFLIDSRRTKEQQLIVRDIETVLSKRGIVLVNVTSARKLTSESKTTISEYIQAEYDSNVTVMLLEIIDESVIGGVRIELPDRQLDATVQAKLDRLTRK